MAGPCVHIMYSGVSDKGFKLQIPKCGPKVKPCSSSVDEMTVVGRQVQETVRQILAKATRPLGGPKAQIPTIGRLG